MNQIIKVETPIGSWEPEDLYVIPAESIKPGDCLSLTPQWLRVKSVGMSGDMQQVIIHFWITSQSSSQAARIDRRVMVVVGRGGAHAPAEEES
jgi:hypothetical protein